MSIRKVIYNMGIAVPKADHFFDQDIPGAESLQLLLIFTRESRIVGKILGDALYP